MKGTPQGQAGDIETDVRSGLKKHLPGRGDKHK